MFSRKDAQRGKEMFRSMMRDPRQGQIPVRPRTGDPMQGQIPVRPDVRPVSPMGFKKGGMVKKAKGGMMCSPRKKMAMGGMAKGCKRSGVK